jgi:dTDP-4-dehydrorhamnose reductase
MKVAVLGASGLLGKALVREWQNDEVVGFSSADIDIRDADRVGDLISKIRSDWVVLAAAYTDVDGCETNPELAFAVNRKGAVNVARAAQASDSRLLFLSSDYVFDGTERSPYETNAPRSPLGVYGQSKAQAEVRLLDIMPDCCILRTSWLFGVDGKCFPDTIVQLAESRPQLDVVDDQRGSPTYTVDLARAIAQLCRKNASGVVHATNSGDCTWFEFAREIVARASRSVEIRPTTSARMARPAPRPAYSVLSPSSLTKFGISMPAWPNALQRYLEERSSRGTV